MTPVVTGRMETPPPIAVTHVPPAVAQPDAWLRELERARWDAQPRYRPGERGDAARLVAPAAPDAPEGTVPRATVTPPADAPHAALATLQHTDAGTRLVQASAAAVAERSGRRTPMPALAAVVPAAERIRDEVLRLLRTQRKVTPATGQPWSARNVHVHADGAGWSVWVRDASLTPRELEPLLQLLSQLAADAGHGLPRRLTLNGRPVAAARLCIPRLAGERHGN